MDKRTFSNEKILKEYMAFLRKEHLDDFTKLNISLNKKLDIPLMKYFAFIPDDEVFKLSRVSNEQFLKDFEEGKAYETASKNLRLWEANELPGISNDMIEPSDLVFISVSQKRAIINFIPKFTEDIEKGVQIIDSLEEFYMVTQEAAFKIYSKLKYQAKQETVKLREEHEESMQDHVIKLEHLNKELEAFTYSVSHDLRAPLRHIDGYIDLLKKNINLDEKNSRYLGIISQSARRMGDLIDELLAFSRLGNTELRKTNINMDELVKEAINNLESETTDRDIEWKIEPLPALEGDKNLLRQVFINLISNALKYSSKETKAKIEIGTIFAGRGPVYFVRDNGAGFNMKYVDKLFGIFQRLHRSSEFEGIGIGLANVKRIVTKHEGRVWAEGKINEGATFYLDFNKTPEI
jgi:signal transduction histidine kinase